jgi:hypothetical protein
MKTPTWQGKTLCVVFCQLGVSSPKRKTPVVVHATNVVQADIVPGIGVPSIVVCGVLSTELSYTASLFVNTLIVCLTTIRHVIAE